MAFELRSSAFRQNQAIPKKYTCDGSDVSIPLNWNDPAHETKGFALIADDPDAPRGTWVHWLLYDLPADTREVAEGIPAKETLDCGAKQGKNDFGKSGYGGPCPLRVHLIITTSNCTRSTKWWDYGRARRSSSYSMQ
jgi:Raf kinase inhibitor-like YbhB/YbcL family protein